MLIVNMAATVLLISDSCNKILQVPFTLDNITGYLESNRLVLKKVIENHNRLSSGTLVINDMLNEIKQRKLDIEKLEEDLKIFYSSIEKNYKVVDETKIGLE